MIIVHRNPISKRMLKIRQQYKPEVYEVTARIVARATDTDPESFDEWMSLRGTGRAQEEAEAWDKYIPWLAKNVNDLLKKQKRGAKVQGELDKLERSFKDTVQPFLRPKKKGQKRPDLMKLSPKEARQYAARVQKALAEKRSEEAERLGFKVVAKLGDGYRAVEALPNLKAPEYPENADLEVRKGWVAENAPFQQWLGVTMVNCIQFYRVNHKPFGKTTFGVQRKGGKLYAVLNAKDEPVAAVLINDKGQLIESNGPNNRAPREKDAEYVDKFIEKHLNLSSKHKGAFYPPENETWDPRITKVIYVILDHLQLSDDTQLRRRFLRKATGYSRQAGANFSGIWRKFAIWSLRDSPLSVMMVAEHSDYPEIGSIIELIREVANLYEEKNRKIEKWNNVRSAAESAEALAFKDGWVSTSMIAGQAMSAVDALIYSGENPDYASDQAALSFMLYGEGSQGSAYVIQDRIKYLLKLLREAAQAAGNQPAHPRRNPSDSLIETCREKWEHYCKRPSKKRLKEVFEHLEAMKSSKSKKVQSERRKCLRVANAEAKSLGMKVPKVSTRSSEQAKNRDDWDIEDNRGGVGLTFRWFDWAPGYALIRDLEVKDKRRGHGTSLVKDAVAEARDRGAKGIILPPPESIESKGFWKSQDGWGALGKSGYRGWMVYEIEKNPAKRSRTADRPDRGKSDSDVSARARKIIASLELTRERAGETAAFEARERIMADVNLLSSLSGYKDFYGSLERYYPGWKRGDFMLLKKKLIF